jgi:hypothetical protein
VVIEKMLASTRNVSKKICFIFFFFYRRL